MRRFAAAVVVVVTCAAPALAAEMPARKAGLWEMKTNGTGGRNMTMQQCVDAKTDQAMQAGASPTPQRDCSKRDIQKSGDTVTIDSTCTVNGRTVTNHSVITGSFDSNYTMVISTQGQGIPAGRTVTIAAKWVGPCAADQKPGDVIMPNGMKMNMNDMQRRGGRPPGAPGGPGAPGAPPQ